MFLEHLASYNGADTVSYTHLDVYKRQQEGCAGQYGEEYKVVFLSLIHISKHAHLIYRCMTYYIYVYQLHCTKQDVLRTSKLLPKSRYA